MLIEDQDQKGIRASGESASSLRIVDVGDTFALVGADYFIFQTRGRGPGKQAPIEAIKEWILQKPIVFQDITLDSLAFVIARKQAQKGSEIFQGKREGLDLEGVLLKARGDFDPEYADLLAKQYADTIMEHLLRVSAGRFSQP